MQNKKKTTIYDIAKRAGVTAATVSRVINGKTNVTEKTREKILRIIEEMDFYPSTIASALSRKKSREVGILSSFFLGDFFLKILESLHAELKQYDVILYSAQSQAERFETLRRIVNENRISGLVIFSAHIFPEEEQLLRKSSSSIVLLECSHPDYTSIYYDNMIGAYKAVSHLIELGHRKIAIIAGKPEKKVLWPIGAERLKGYKLALKTAQITPNENHIIPTEWNRQDAYEKAKQLLVSKDRPTAIFAVSDMQAIGVMNAAKDLGIRVPEDLSVIGFDNMEISEIVGLTTMMQQYSILAKNAAHSLLTEMASGQRKKDQVMLQPELIIRSTAAKPRQQ